MLDDDLLAGRPFRLHARRTIGGSTGHSLRISMNE
jgi:hypothetical protein